MKKNIYTLAIYYVLMSVLNLNCSSLSKDTNTLKISDLEKENLKGDVILVISDETDFTFFDEQGQKIKEVKKLKGGDDVFYFTEYRYKNNKISSTTQTKGYNSVTTYYYNSAGTLTHSETKMSFDELSELNSTLTNYYTYNENNQIIQDSLSTGVVTKYFYSNKQLDSVWLGEKQKEFYKNGVIETKLTFDYTENETSSTTTTFKYSYDPNGNWTQQIGFENGRKTSSNQRVIFYKGDDITTIQKQYDVLFSKLNSHVDKSSSASESPNKKLPTNSKSSTNSNTKQNIWINCFDCQGKGIRACYECGQRGTMMCEQCRGSGIWSYNNQKCTGCGGSGIKQCSRCYGKGNLGYCSTCRGRGQVQE